MEWFQTESKTTGQVFHVQCLSIQKLTIWWDEWYGALKYWSEAKSLTLVVHWHRNYNFRKHVSKDKETGQVAVSDWINSTAGQTWFDSDNPTNVMSVHPKMHILLQLNQANNWFIGHGLLQIFLHRVYAAPQKRFGNANHHFKHVVCLK